MLPPPQLFFLGCDSHFVFNELIPKVRSSEKSIEQPYQI